MERRPRIVVLNGAGSAGKGSIARALQRIAAAPLLHVEMDAFLAMMPERAWDNPDGIVFETIEEDGHPSVVIRTGPICDKAMAGMRRAVAALAAAGNDLIVDEVMTLAERRDYEALLAPFTAHYVGVMAPLDVLEAREKARGDRAIGLARWQFPRIHAGQTYDLEVDTGQATPEACAERIRRAFGL